MTSKRDSVLYGKAPVCILIMEHTYNGETYRIHSHRDVDSSATSNRNENVENKYRSLTTDWKSHLFH